MALVCFSDKPFMVALCLCVDSTEMGIYGRQSCFQES